MDEHKVINRSSEKEQPTKSNNTRIINLRLHIRRSIQHRLRAHLERDAAMRRLGVVHGLGARLDVAAHAVVVARRERVEVVQPVQGDAVLGRVVPERGGVPRDVAPGDVVRGFGADEEAVATEDGVGGEGWSLSEQSGVSILEEQLLTRRETRTDLEHIQRPPNMQPALLIAPIQHRRLRALIRAQARRQIQLEALRQDIIHLDDIPEHIRRGPRLREGDAVQLVRVLALDVAGDGVRLGVAHAGDFEGDVGGGLGFDFERGALEGVVFLEEVVGGFAEVLGGDEAGWLVSLSIYVYIAIGITFQEGGTG